MCKKTKMEKVTEGEGDLSDKLSIEVWKKIVVRRFVRRPVRQTQAQAEAEKG